MKKITIVLILISIIIVNNTWADITNNLKNRLDKINSFHSSFIQKAIDERGNVLQESRGDLWVKRPNLFNWHVSQPEKSILVSDGKTLWFYNPLVEQVTAIWLKDAASNIPFMLITRNKISDWNQYSIKQTGDNFEITPKINNSNLKNLLINISIDGIINQFSIVEQNNQCNIYDFRFQQNYVVDESIFVFTPPSGVTIDDQRIG